MDSIEISQFEARQFGAGITFLSLGQDEMIDWFRVFIDLKKSGYSLNRVSREIGIAPGTIKGWKSGSRPKFEDALLLIALWVSATEKNTEQLPRKKSGG